MAYVPPMSRPPHDGPRREVERDEPTIPQEPRPAALEILAEGGPDDPEARFVDEGLLGHGGAGVVRRAWDQRLLRHVAIKRLTAGSDSARARFRTEAQITAQLEHPHIVPVHDHGDDPDGEMFMTMKLVSGRTLGQRLAELGARRLEPDELAELLGVLGQVCDALAYAHSRGVIHRDLKPSNVMVGEFGQVYVMDWGIARLASEGVPRPVRTTDPVATQPEVSGTPAYMPPEQGTDGEPADPRIDVYSLGGLLYAILTGDGPHPTITWGEPREPVVPPDSVVQDGVVPAGLARIAMRALSQDPADRHPDVSTFKSELLAFQNGTWQLPTRRVAAGHPVVREGEPGAEAFVIVRGTCVVERERDGIVGEIGPGGVFGEMAVLTGRPRDATVRARTDVVLQVVSQDTLTEGLGLDAWTGRFVKALAQRVVDLTYGRS